MVGPGQLSHMGRPDSNPGQRGTRDPHSPVHSYAAVGHVLEPQTMITDANYDGRVRQLPGTGTTQWRIAVRVEAGTLPGPARSAAQRLACLASLKAACATHARNAHVCTY